jgi:hypothetical protein
MGVGPSRNAYRTEPTADTLTPLVGEPVGASRGLASGTGPSRRPGLPHTRTGRVPRFVSVPASTVRSVAERDTIRTIDEEATSETGLPSPRRGSGSERRCGWCRRVLPQQGSVGRPRQYCGQACRQRAYEQRSATAKAGLSGDVVLVTRAELDGLQDRLYQLRCAIEDVQTLLGERHTKAELERSLQDLVHSTGRLDRLWVSERAAG